MSFLYLKLIGWYGEILRFFCSINSKVWSEIMSQENIISYLIEIRQKYSVFSEIRDDTEYLILESRSWRPDRFYSNIRNSSFLLFFDQNQI